MKIKEFIEKHKELKKTFENIDCSKLDSKTRIEIKKAIKILDKIIEIIYFACKDCKDFEEEFSDDVYKIIQHDYRAANISRFFF